MGDPKVLTPQVAPESTAHGMSTLWERFSALGLFAVVVLMLHVPFSFRQ
jgi:hypothetical protein